MTCFHPFWMIAGCASPSFTIYNLSTVIRKQIDVQDTLTRMSAKQEVDFRSFESLPVDVFNVFQQNFNGLYLNRLCPKPVGVS